MTTGFAICFLVLAAVALAAAAKMIFSHHPVHSALYLVLNLCASALIYVLLGAPFIAIVQVAVYAGAIMVLFLFIIMYLNLGLAQDVADARSRRATALATAGLLAVLLLAGGVVRWSGDLAGRPQQVAAGQQALAAGQAGLPGAPAATPDAQAALQAARAAAQPQPGQAVTVEQIGVALFSRYALPFEVASLLILVAMIGALVIARPQLQRESALRKEVSS
ncbi:MAG: NADH-quinone oxidoreductase subunit J [Fimbriimonadaceae bacterium]|nr:NADH-quinone oxidoreductase subunit J [Fimbriimonadaceae bacterium]